MCHGTPYQSVHNSTVGEYGDNEEVAGIFVILQRGKISVKQKPKAYYLNVNQCYLFVIFPSSIVISLAYPYTMVPK